MLAPDLPSRDRDSALYCSYYYCRYGYYSLGPRPASLSFHSTLLSFFFFSFYNSFSLSQILYRPLSRYNPHRVFHLVNLPLTIRFSPDRPDYLEDCIPTTRLPGQHSSLLPPSPSLVSVLYFSMTEIKP